MKNFNIKYLVLITLFMILIIPMLNTANLYGNYSSLYGLEKEIVRYLLGIGFEVCIFVCVLAGYRPAGIFSAVISFLIGLLYHINFNDIRTFDNWFTHQLLSSVIIQLGISIMVYFLSEIYVILNNRDNKRNDWRKVIKRIEADEEILKDLKKEKDIILYSVIELSDKKEKIIKELQIIQQNKSTTENEIKKYQQDLINLKKTKAGMSTYLKK